jgi:putative heme transporter
MSENTAASAVPPVPPTGRRPLPRAAGRPLRRGWLGVAQLVACVAIAVGAGVAIYAERATISEGATALRHAEVGWLLAGFGAEFISMIALVQLQRGLLRGVGARPTLRSVLATAYSSNAIAITVPIIGSGIATAYAFRELRRAGSAPELVSMALTVAGIFSSVAFAIVAAAGALITGNPAAAAAGLAASVTLSAAVAAVIVALRFPRARDWLVGRLAAVLRLSKRVIRRPRGEPGPLITGVLERMAGLRLGYVTAGRAFGWALVNWIADVACLVCAIAAVREPVPWAAVLIVWSAGAGAASFSPVPGGIGIVDIVLIAALATAGLHDAKAVAAVLLYRVISLKFLTSAGWLGYHAAAGRRARGRRSAEDLDQQHPGVGDPGRDAQQPAEPDPAGRGARRR